MKVKIECIKIMERIRKEITKIDELAEDINANGLLNPITVMMLDSEKYRLLAGLRRLKAVISLGLDEIAVNVVTPADAEAALRIEISENEQREPFNFSEKMDFARMLEEVERVKSNERKLLGKKIGSNDLPPNLAEGQKGETREIVAGKIGMSKSTYDCAKYIANNAPAEIIETLDKGERTIHSAYKELRANEKALQSTIPTVSDAILITDANQYGSSNDDATFAGVKEPFSVKTPPAAKHPKSRPLKEPLKEPPEGCYMSEQDKEALRKIREFSAMTPEEKIVELQRQLKEERARAAGAESGLARLKELYNNEKLHNRANVNNLKMQINSLDLELTAAFARIKELEDKCESK